MFLESGLVLPVHGIVGHQPIAQLDRGVFVDVAVRTVLPLKWKFEEILKTSWKIRIVFSFFYFSFNINAISSEENRTFQRIIE